jgi:hypothetical protein
MIDETINPYTNAARTSAHIKLLTLFSIGDSLAYHNGMKFSTIDMDNDPNSATNVAEDYHGAWW